MHAPGATTNKQGAEVVDTSVDVEVLGRIVGHLIKQVLDVGLLGLWILEDSFVDLLLLLEQGLETIGFGAQRGILRTQLTHTIIGTAVSAF